MTPERWARVEALFHEAHGCQPADRPAFLAAACDGDHELRHDVEALLAESGSGELWTGAGVPPAGRIASEVLQAVLAGRSLGSYRLQSLLGVGGMGQVYRAHDDRLGRDVAIKVLSGAFVADSNRLARFEREARLLAALNHQNICGIHAVEEADGLRFLVLELVDGETLAETLAAARGAGLGLSRTLACARQIAEALEAAHEKGIVHRDLKPANVKIRPDGVVKVLDFGIAKTLSPGDTPLGATREGTVVGTAAYMSPEQARGLPVDTRTDIWAYGCVLFEMLTGQVPFAGQTASDTIASILEREPDWSALPPATPDAVRRLLFRALVKDPRRRLRDIGDARIEIEGLGDPVPGLVEARPVADRVSARWLPWAAWLALATAVAVWAARGASDRDPLAGATFTQLTDWEGSEGNASISPDGRFVAFFADKDGAVDLWTHQVGSGGFKNLTLELRQKLGPVAARMAGPGGLLKRVSFSPDGAELAFSGPTQGRLSRIPETGGTPRLFLGDGAVAAAWSADGRLTYMVDSHGDPLFVADQTGDDAHQIAMTPTVDWAGASGSAVHNHNPVWAVDGQWIYFVHGFLHDLSRADDMDIWRIRPSGGTPERITYLNRSITFLTPIDARTLVYVGYGEDGGGPWLWALDLERRTTRRVSSGLEHYSSVAASRDGRRLVATLTRDTSSLVRVSAGGAAVADAEEPYLPLERALAPRLVGAALYYLAARGQGDGLWRFENGHTAEVLRAEEGPLTEPAAVSPDGNRLAVVRRRAGREYLSVTRADGTEARTIVPDVHTQGAPEWSPDSQSIAIGGKDAKGLALFRIDVDTGTVARMVDGEAVTPIWSAQANLIVYGGTIEAGQVQLHAVRPDGTRVELPDILVRPGGYRFLRDGSGIVYLPRGARDFMLFDLASRASRQLTHLTTDGRIGSFDLTPDGRYLVFDRPRANSDIVLIDLHKQASADRIQ